MNKIEVASSKMSPKPPERGSFIPSSVKSLIAIGVVGFSCIAITKGLLHTSKYSEEVPKKISERFTANDTRVKEALVAQKAQSKIDTESLNRSSLAEIANNVNASVFHYSGNCELLSQCLLYNLTEGKQALAARNTYPVYKGFSTAAVANILFGSSLVRIGTGIKSIKQMEDRIIAHFEKTGERFYVVNSRNYSVPLLGPSGHSLNAVVLFDSEKKPYVQYVDAWKTSEYTPSSDRLANRYKDGEFSILTRARR